MIEEHAPLSPSAMGQFIACTGAKAMQARFPQLTPNDETEEGTAAHWVASETLEHWKATGEVLTFWIGKTSPNNILITDEIEDSAFVYINAVLKIIREKETPREQVYIEFRLYAPQIHADLWGTADLVIIRGHEIFVFDFKHGHLHVSEYENWQLICYLAGIINWLQIDGIKDQYYTAHLVVVQPRVYNRRGPVRTWTTKLSNLRGYFNFLRAKCVEILEDPVLTSGPQCRDCSARHSCEAARIAANDAIAYSRGVGPEELDALSIGVELSFIRRAMNALKYRQTGLLEVAEIKARAGERVPFHSIHPHQSRLAWTKEAGEVVALGELLNIDLSKKGVKTPTQALKAGIDENIINAYATRENVTKFEYDDGERAKLIFGGGDAENL